MALNKFLNNYTKNRFNRFKDVKPTKPLRSLRHNNKKSSKSQSLTYSIDTFKNQTLIDNSLFNFVNVSADVGETLPWGVQAVCQGEDISKRGNFASDCYAFVIDSGVSDTTGDINLVSNPNWHRSWISGETPFTDGNGHGTHVSGTIAALVNDKGIVGVAPGAQIVSLKVFDSSGAGATDTTIIDAINYAVNIINTNNLDKNKVVINMSLSGGYSSALDTLMRSVADQGIRFSVAAGNNAQDADNYSPSSTGDHSNVFCVSAVDNTNKMPFWSNWDQVNTNDQVDNVDFAAPGVGILSYYKNGQLAYLSGTSMATAHVSGLLITGGVQAGTIVNPTFSNTADPFAITSTQAYIPPPPSPIYTINSSSTINEGQALKIDILTANVLQGTSLYWRLSGTGINLSDFDALSSLSGNVVTKSDGTASIDLSLKEDATTENVEVLNFELFSDASFLNKVSGKSISIQDTSKTPAPVVVPGMTLWGTTGNDTLTGGAGKDIITGVLSSGTTPTAMGSGQIDVLTGGAGSDVFLLGDSRGAFYDDGNKGNPGLNDYAIIKDFKVGEDKLQVKKGNAYSSSISEGNYFLYLDTNRNGRVDLTGSNPDDLLSIVEGVSRSLVVNDFIRI